MIDGSAHSQVRVGNVGSHLGPVETVLIGYQVPQNMRTTAIFEATSRHSDQWRRIRLLFLTALVKFDFQVVLRLSNSWYRIYNPPQPRYCFLETNYFHHWVVDTAGRGVRWQLLVQAHLFSPRQQRTLHFDSSDRFIRMFGL